MTAELGQPNRFIDGYALGHLTAEERAEDLRFATAANADLDLAAIEVDPVATALFVAMTSEPGWDRYCVGALKRPATQEERRAIDRAAKGLTS